MKKALGLIILLAVIHTAQSQTAAEYCKNAAVKIEAKNYTGALSDYTSAIKIDASFTEAYTGRANTYYLMEKYTEALTDYTKAISLDPENGFLYYLRGYAYIMLDDRDKACADFNKSEELGDDYGYSAVITECN